MQPTARAINLRTDKPGQNQEEDTSQVHRQRAPFDPAIIHQACDHEGEKADRDPARLFAPEFRRDGVLAHVSGTVDRNYTENSEREHGGAEEPVKAQQFSKKWGHESADYRPVKVKIARSPVEVQFRGKTAFLIILFTLVENDLV
jgi:hypothetical protein